LDKTQTRRTFLGGTDFSGVKYNGRECCQKINKEVRGDVNAGGKAGGPGRPLRGVSAGFGKKGTG